MHWKRGIESVTLLGAGLAPPPPKKKKKTLCFKLKAPVFGRNQILAPRSIMKKPMHGRLLSGRMVCNS